jgi:hypothetical protein
VRTREDGSIDDMRTNEIESYASQAIITLQINERKKRHSPSSADDKSSQSQQFGENDLTSRMQSLLVIRTVKFDEHITVYELNDWPADAYLDTRRGQWMQHAVDRCRFERRIRQTEIELGNIFSDKHRKRIVYRLNQ